MSAALRQAVARQLGLAGDERIGVAVSGGSDSLALLHLLHDICSGKHGMLYCVTVDHGLRSASAEEAAFVKSVCRTLGVSHDTLRWQGWDGQGNTQAEARAARYRLIAAWAAEKGITRVALGHTQNDQAETVLLRLARGSGVDGLSAMSARRTSHGVVWERPMLSLGREDLRLYLRAKKIQWVEDPSNEDMRYDRIRARKALDVLQDLGVGAADLAQVAQNMQQARVALDHAALQAARTHAGIIAGALCFRWTELQELPDEISRRLLVAALRWLTCADYPPRRKALEAALDALRNSGAATLDGCLLRLKKDRLWISREYNAVRGARVPCDHLWDGRWRCHGGAGDTGIEIAALGQAGLRELPDWRKTEVPRDVLMVSPALWRGNQLVAAPLVKPGQPWQAVLERGEDAFFDAVFPH